LARIFFIVVCLIIYGSLYPWQFQTTHFVSSPVTILVHSWPASFNRYVFRDAVVNVLLYAPLGIFGYLLFLPRLRKAGAVAAVLASAATLSTAVELVQFYEAFRYSSIFDIACNLTGAAAGLIVASVYTESLMPLVAWSQRGEFLHVSAGGVLLLCWVAYQTVPIFPQLSTTQFLLKLRSLGTRASWSLVELAVSFVDWLAVAAVVEDVAGPNSARLVLTVGMLLLPGRLFLEGRSLAAAECVGALLAVFVWRHSFGKRSDRFLLIAWLSLAALILRGLAPFHLGLPQEFSWIPFAASLSYDQAAAQIGRAHV